MTTSPNAKPIIDWFFENSGALNLGRAAGLDAETAERLLRHGLPRQLEVLEAYSRTKLGDQQIKEAIAVIPEFPSVTEALTAGNGALDLARAGESLAPTLLRDGHEQIVGAAAGETGVKLPAARQLFTMTLPLILSRLSWRDEPALRFLPLVGQVKKTGPVLIPRNAAIAAAPRHAAQTVTADATQRKGLPWWLLLLPLLLLLLLLGGCLMGRRTAPAAAPTAATTVTDTFTITNPAPGSEVSANGFSLEGTGPAEQTYTLHRAGQQIGSFTVGKDNRWKTDVLDTAAPAGDVIYTVQDAKGNTAGILNVKAKGPDGANVAKLEITNLKADNEVSAGGFTLQGTAQPGTNYTIFEDGANIGTFTSGPDGTWALNVPGPSAGNHTYTILDAAGNRVALLPLTVVGGPANTNCTDPLSISLSNNATVSAPFRFGGRGGGKGYTITVWRGDRQIGSTEVKLSGDCAWSYASNPGGKDGQKTTVRYEVRPTGTPTSTPAAGQVTLNVSGSGTNFNSQGEYVGPTK